MNLKNFPLIKQKIMSTYKRKHDRTESLTQYELLIYSVALHMAEKRRLLTFFLSADTYSYIYLPSLVAFLQQ